MDVHPFADITACFSISCRYEPESTAAIILTGSEGGEAEDAAAEVCKEASIEVVVRQAAGRAATVYLRDGKEALET